MNDLTICKTRIGLSVSQMINLYIVSPGRCIIYLAEKSRSREMLVLIYSRKFPELIPNTLNLIRFIRNPEWAWRAELHPQKKFIFYPGCEHARRFFYEESRLCLRRGFYTLAAALILEIHTKTIGIYRSWEPLGSVWEAERKVGPWARENTTVYRG